jgi:hypothetical protein
MKLNNFKLFFIVTLLNAKTAFCGILPLTYFSALPIVPDKLVGGNVMARNKAQHAMLMQSGFSDKLEAIDGELQKRTNRIKNAVFNYIDNDTGLNSKYVVVVMAFGHSIFIEKRFSLTFNSPIVSKAIHTIYWDTNQYGLSFQAPF